MLRPYTNEIKCIDYNGIPFETLRLNMNTGEQQNSFYSTLQSINEANIYDFAISHHANFLDWRYVSKRIIEKSKKIDKSLIVVKFEPFVWALFTIDSNQK